MANHDPLPVAAVPRRTLATSVFLGYAALVMATGCGERTSLAPLSGSVTYQGKPLEFGGVMMQPVTGGPVSRGVIQADGTFVMQTDGRTGAPIGVNRVRVTCFTSQKPDAAGANSDGEASLGDLLIPERYTRLSSSGLSVEVKADENEPYQINLPNK